MDVIGCLWHFEMMMVWFINDHNAILIIFKDEDKVWVQNIKKGIISTFQTSMTDWSQEDIITEPSDMYQSYDM